MIVRQTRGRPPILYITYVNPWPGLYGGAMRCQGILRGLTARAPVDVVLVSSDAHVRAAFLEAGANAGVSCHVAERGLRHSEQDDEAASRSAGALLGRGPFHWALRKFETELSPGITWYFETESLRRAGLPIHSRTVLDHCDVRSRKHSRAARLETGPKRLRATMRAAAIRLEETGAALLTDIGLVASPTEANSLRPAAPLRVVPNGADFPPELPHRLVSGERLVFFGSLFYAPNAHGMGWFCREVWPRVLAARPQASLDVIGLGGGNLTEIANSPRTSVLGWVDSLDEVIQGAAGLIAPLQIGGGTRIKIVEAWSRGLPVVSTSVGAEGLAAVDGLTALIGDSPEDLADRCVRLLSDGALGGRLASAGFDHGKRHFDWRVIHKLLDAVLEDRRLRHGD